MPDLTRFLACWPNTLAQEAPFPKDWSNPHNFSNDPGDPGGKTMDGIIQTEYDHYCRTHGLPQVDVRNITKDQGQDIYYNEFWLPHCPNVPVGLDLQLFDANVNEGIGEGVRILQVALGVKNDGIWGPATEGAINAIKNLMNVIELFTARRKVVYRETSGFDRFGGDWIRRATEIGDESLHMASGGHPADALFTPGITQRVPRAMLYMPNRE